MVDLREVDCCVVVIKCEENGHRLPPASPRHSKIYRHTITGWRRGEDDNKEDISGLILMLVNKTDGQEIGGTADESVLTPCGGCEYIIIGAH